MAQFVADIPPEAFTPLLTELQRRVLPINYERIQSGTGRSQAFGVIRRWSYTPWLSRMTWMRPELWQLLQDFAAQYVPIPWDAVQVNENYASAPHTDKGNRDDSWIVGFGDYAGGELVVENTLHQIRHRAHIFNGSQRLHWTNPWDGHRYSLVFFRIVIPPKYEPWMPVTSRLVEDGLEVTDTYDNSIVVLNRKGKVVRTIREAEPRPIRRRLTAAGQPATM